MFDKLINELKNLERVVKIPVNLPVDDDGYFDRECHAETCHAEFKVLYQDWQEKVSDEKVYCPICRHEAPSSEWNTDEQHEYIKAIAIAHMQDVVHSALNEDTRRFNRAQRPGFVQISMSTKRGTHPTIVPDEAAKAMRQQFTCEVCGCHYASIGTAFFCPACSHNSAVLTFSKTIETVRKIVALAPSIRTTLAKEYDDDLAQDSVRNTLEDSLVRLVGAFQQYADALFDQLPNSSSYKRHKNIFQNLPESSALWRSAVGKGYENMLLAAELDDLESLFQKRHLIAHRNGIVDQEYLDKSKDKTYLIGQRLVSEIGLHTTCKTSRTEWSSVPELLDDGVFSCYGISSSTGISKASLSNSRGFFPSARRLYNQTRRESSSKGVRGRDNATR